MAKKLKPGDQCPTCKRRVPAPWTPRKICATCKKPMSRSDKYQFDQKGVIRHRVCERPTEYE